MERIRVIAKKVDNTWNEGKKIFFCVEDICKAIGFSKEEWNKRWSAYGGPIEKTISPVINEYSEEYNEFLLQNHYVEVLHGATGSYEILFCTIFLFKQILDYDDFMKIMDLLDVDDF